MKIALFGADGFTCQVPRIVKTLFCQGHEIDYIKPDLIYSNDPGGFKKAIELKENSGGFLILNILDIPWHVQELNDIVDNLKKELKCADLVTSISQTTKNDVLEVLNIQSKVIYNPIRSVFYNSLISKQKKYLYVGRANDPNKRFNLIKQTVNPNDLTVVGSENPNFGFYTGIISDEDLNYLYNCHKYVLLPSKNEGIGMSMIEGMATGTIPITCNDCEAALEFNDEDFICDPSPESLLAKITELDKNYETWQKVALSYGEKYKKNFDISAFCNNIIGLCPKS